MDIVRRDLDKAHDQQVAQIKRTYKTQIKELEDLIATLKPKQTPQERVAQN